jgi:hypothetical protein
MTIYKTLPLNDNTSGFRFDLLGFKGIYRKRILKTRWGITKGETMRAIHYGKRSVYLELSRPRRKLHDFALRHWAIAYALVFTDGKV